MRWGSPNIAAARSEGQCTYPLTALPAALQQLKEGELRALAVSTDRRYPVLASVPTFREQGLRGFLVTSWFGLMVPKDTSPEMVTKLNGELQKALVTPKLRDAVVEAGSSVSRLRPENFDNFIKTEIQIWGPFRLLRKPAIDEAGIGLIQQESGLSTI